MGRADGAHLDDLTANELHAVRVDQDAVHELIGERDRVPAEQVAFVERSNRGMALYLERRFAEAAEVFRASVNEQSEDRPSQIMLERCAGYVAAPPPAEWDGVVHMRSK